MQGTNLQLIVIDVDEVLVRRIHSSIPSHITFNEDMTIVPLSIQYCWNKAPYNHGLEVAKK